MATFGQVGQVGVQNTPSFVPTSTPTPSTSAPVHTTAPATNALSNSGLKNAIANTSLTKRPVVVSPFPYPTYPAVVAGTPLFIQTTPLANSGGSGGGGGSDASTDTTKEENKPADKKGISNLTLIIGAAALVGLILILKK